MKIKLAAYATAAVLIGFAVMMLPLAMKTEPPSYTPEWYPREYTSSETKGGNDQRNQLGNTDGFTSQPTNMLPLGLILLAGLAVAIVAYASLRKQLK